MSFHHAPIHRAAQHRPAQHRPALHRPVLSRRLFLGGIGATVVLAACGSSDEAASTSSGGGDDGTATTGIRLVSAQEGAEIQASPPEDLVILDVRTAEEFAEGHLEGAILLDFYRDDFAERLAELDPNVPYLLYCRSGNRSQQTTALMEELNFADVADIDGGIVSWTDAGLPTVTS